MKFVDKIANYICEKNLPLSHLTIVLPSERMKKYLLAAMFRRYQKPIPAPEIITIDHWIRSHSRKTVIDKTRVLLELFKIQLNHARNDDDRSFDEFLSWGEILMNDFNELDRHLLDAQEIFRNLEDIKEIENWSFGEGSLSDGQKRFMEFWEKLPAFYFELNEALNRNNMCYSGRAFREAAEDTQRFFTEDADRQFVFAGFNALSPSELSIINQLERGGRAQVLIDADKVYFNNQGHEAGFFLRNLQSTLNKGKLDFISDVLQHKELNIELVECAQNTGQVKVAATKLAALSREELDDTLLLLADESLIVSMIKNLPSEIGKANITLGLPIRNTAIRTWIDLIFSIQENKRRFKTDAVYHVDLQALLSHPFVQAILDSSEKSLIQTEELKSIKNNRIFVKKERFQVSPKMTFVLDKITVDWHEQGYLDAVRIIRELNSGIFSSLNSEFAFEKAIIECFDKALAEFENILLEGIPEMNFKSFSHLFNQHWQSKSIAYHGNPMTGLQITGLLETRGLDFKRIICIGMNEGNLPPKNAVETLIPMDLRRYHGLPTPREKHGLFAHHFYRLLGECNNLLITYCTAEQSMGISEPSRYILQIEKELSRQNPKIRINRKIYALEMRKQKMHLSVEKTPEILKRMDELLSESGSASMFKKYIECPLDFYFRYIMDFGESDEVEEEIEQNTFGTFIHGTLEKLYEPFAHFDNKGNKIEPAPGNITSFDVEKMLRNYSVILKSEFRKHFNDDDEAFTKGKNLLSYKMASELIERYLKSEIAFFSTSHEKVFIESLERKFELPIEIKVGDEIKVVNLKGYIDRIDRVGEKVRIIDYKSGKIDKIDATFFSKGDDLIEKSIKTRKHVLQLMQYAYLYQQREGVLPEVSLISFISGNFQPFTLDTKDTPLDLAISDFPAQLETLINEMYDIEKPFEHRHQYNSYCKYCD